LEILIVLIVLVLLVLGGLVLFFYFKPTRPRRTDSLYTDALNAMLRGDQRRAMLLFRDVIRQDTDHIDAYLQLGNLLRETAPQQAIKVHQSLTVRPNLSPELRVEIHQALALDYKQVNNLKRARREAEHILKIQRRNRWALEFLLEIAESERDWNEAAKLARLLQRVRDREDPTQLARYQVYEGLDKLAQGDRKGARTSFQKAAKMQPDFGLPHLYLGDLYEEERDLVKAIDHWERFVFLAPQNSEQVFTKIETALFDLGRFSEAEKFYRRVLEKDVGNLTALTKLANVLEEKGETQSALNLVEEALSRNPDSIPARLMKLKLMLNQSPPPELARQIDEIIEVISRSPHQDD
jgi:lipopolysaccharide biosynthesis regulator YciM